MASSAVRRRAPATKEKQKKKKNRQDFNKKADEKEGTDMDAFLGDDKPSKNITPPPVLVETPPAPPPQQPDNDAELEEMKKEEKKVAEKNEENTRMSSAAPEEQPPAESQQETKPTEDPSTPQLKYIYEAGQWSPSNPSGKKKYGREFLLKMQFDPVCLKKPSLPMVEIIRDTPTTHKLLDANRFSSVNIMPGRDTDPFMPNFIRPNNQMRGSQGGMKRGRGQPSQEKTKKIIIAPSVPQTVELRTSENAWKPMSRVADINKTQEELEDERVYREVRSILNKLTPEKFSSLVKQLQEVKIDTVARLEGVISLVFEKAVDEPKFAVPYANMCKHLAKMNVTVEGSEQSVSFRKLLLTKCQRAFEKDFKEDERLQKLLKERDNAETDEKKQQKKDEYEDQLRKARRRSLGNIRFIGELYKLGMLTAAIMHECLKKLMVQRDEDSLECFCHLIHTVGQNLAAEPKAKLKQAMSMEDYFRQVKAIVDQGEVSSRIKFLLLDTLEFKENNYISTRISTPAQNNPTTIASIHQEAQREAIKAHQDIHLPKRQDDRDRKKGKGRSGSNYQSSQMEDGWSMSGSRSKKELAIEPTKRLYKLDAESLQFGRGGTNPHSWARGSSGGAKQASSEAGGEKQQGGTMCTNRYSALASNEAPERHRGGQRSAASSRESSRNGGRQLPPPGVRKSLSQTSATHEKEEVISVLKTIVKGSHSQKLMPSSSESASGQHDQKVTKKPPAISSLASDSNILMGGDMSDEAIEREARMIYDEYVNNDSAEEVVILLTEKASPNTIERFLSEMMNLVLDRNAKAREMFGPLMNVLLSRKVLSPELFTRCLADMVANADSLSLDYPRIEEYLAQMALPVFLGREMSSPGFLREVCTECLHSRTSSKFITHLLKLAAGSHPVLAADKWHSAGLQLSDFLPPSVDVKEHIATHNLEFLLGLKPLEALLKNNSSNEEVINWIEKNIVTASQTKFIRALTTTLLESGITGSGADCSANMEALKSRMPVLQKLVGREESAELEVLYAIQLLMARLEHPKDLILALFNLVYEEDVVEEEAFLKWKNCKEPAEMEGRSLALVSSQRFFQDFMAQED